ncbi:MAG: hypothetical protein U9P73_02825 [Candidatus Cloacimonadota bacterium]|nr:hypothetical protein [Candidatus Cloacimonadota bacterium]
MSSADLSELKCVFEEKCELLHGAKEDDGNWHLCIEAQGSGVSGRTPTDDIEQLISVISDLNNKQSELLTNTEKLDFNIGWQSNKKRPEGSFTIANGLLEKVTKIGATLTVTIYPSCENDNQ